MNAQTTIAKPARAKLTLARKGEPARVPAQEVLPPVAGIHIVPSAPQVFALRRLRRAPENVRHTRIDEDVVGLADDIAAHGLLQSLIGYADDDLIHIVGGGRRFQALRRIEDEGLIDGDFPVPVLIRGVEEAIELSLSENLQQRTMSPVDEFFAFRALMENEANSPQILAKRFGFSERVVRQRLRMAALAPEILDELAARKITLDVAMAYAKTQDQALQLLVFRAEKKRSWDPHRLTNISHALSMKGLKTEDPVFRYLGAAAYEGAGGRYEDDLFIESGGEQMLASPVLALQLAAAKIEADWPAFAEAQRARADLAPTIAGFVVPPDLRIRSWGNDEAKAPAGLVRVNLNYADPAKQWKTIRNNGLSVHALVGIDDKGALVIHPRTVFVDKKQRGALEPPPAASAATLTPEQLAAATRLRETTKLQRRLAVGPFAGTPLEGRASWAEGWSNGPRAVMRDGVPGWMVPVDIFVTDEEIAAQADAAAARYDELVAEEAERQREADRAKLVADLRAERMRAMDPPVVAIVDGEVWISQDDGSYVTDILGDGHLENWQQLLDVFDAEEIITFATREAFDAREVGA